MIIFEIALIILVAAPVVGLAAFLFSQLSGYVRKKNARDSRKDQRRSGRR